MIRRSYRAFYTINRGDAHAGRENCGGIWGCQANGRGDAHAGRENCAFHVAVVADQLVSYSFT